MNMLKNVLHHINEFIMIHPIFHKVNVIINPLEICNIVCPPLATWRDVVNAGIFSNNKFFASIGTFIFLGYEEIFYE